MGGAVVNGIKSTMGNLMSVINKINVAVSLVLLLCIGTANASPFEPPVAPTYTSINSFGALGNFVPVSGGTGSGTDNYTVFMNALQSCKPIYIPSGDYYLSSKIILTPSFTSPCDVKVKMDGTIHFAAANKGFTFQPAFGPQEPVTAFKSGTGISNAGTFNSASCTNCANGDIFEVKQTSIFCQNRRTCPRLQVVDSTASPPTITVINPGIVYENTNTLSAAPTTTVISGASNAALVLSGITWSVPPPAGHKLLTQITVSGTNAVSADGNCITFGNGDPSWCVGNKLKILSNHSTAFNYSNSMTRASADAFLLAKGGAGCTVGDTLSATTLTTPFGAGTVGMPVHPAGANTLASSVAGVSYVNGSATVTWTGHGLPARTAVYLETTSALPTNFAVATVYYVSATNLATNTFELAATPGGVSISAGSAGSGTQTALATATYTVATIDGVGATGAATSLTQVYGGSYKYVSGEAIRSIAGMT